MHNSKENLGDYGDESIYYGNLSIYHAHSCSNSSDFESGEIKANKILKEALIARQTSTILLDTKENRYSQKNR